MKSANRIARIVFTLLGFALCTSASFAATNPLYIPRGLAVDASGNLWVANAGTNSILCFTPGYKQLTANTITNGVSEPTGVAFDAQGNLWVSNYDPSSVTEYTNGVLDTTITNNISLPGALAFDGLGNLWVANNTGYSAYITVFAPNAVYGPPTSLLQVISPNESQIDGIAVSGGNVVWGDGAYLNFAPATQGIATGALNGVTDPGTSATYMTTTSNGTVYYATAGFAVNSAAPSSFGSYTTLIELTYPPAGLAVDPVRGRIYISTSYENTILVYSLTGNPLHTID